MLLSLRVFDKQPSLVRGMFIKQVKKISVNGNVIICLVEQTTCMEILQYLLNHKRTEFITGNFHIISIEMYYVYYYHAIF